MKIINCENIVIQKFYEIMLMTVRLRHKINGVSQVKSLLKNNGFDQSYNYYWNPTIIIKTFSFKQRLVTFATLSKFMKLWII
jgi:hypothetical protein